MAEGKEYILEVSVIIDFENLTSQSYTEIKIYNNLRLSSVCVCERFLTWR